VVFWAVTPCNFVVDTSTWEKHTPIFMFATSLQVAGIA
jgi:hypothetical protein